MKKKWIVWIGYVVLILSFLFIISKFRQYTIDLSGLFTVSNSLAVLACTILYGITAFMNAFLYQLLYCSLTKEYIPPKRIIRVYLQSHLYRYLPGNVLHYVGRNQLAAEYNVSHATVAGVTILEILTMVFSCVLIIAIFSFRSAIVMLRDIPILIVILIAAVLVAAFLILLYFKIPQRWIRKHFDNISRKSLLLVGAAIVHRLISFILFGLMFGALLQLSTVPLQYGQWGEIIGRYSLSWLIGLITPGAPGGLGVREGMLLMLLSSTYGESAVMRTAILMRMVTILGDVIAFAVAAATLRTKPAGEKPEA